MKKRLPYRMCIGCRQSRPKSELLRITIKPDEGVAFDLSRRTEGRGAYICPEIDCFNIAFKKKAFSKAMKNEISQENLSKLREEMKKLVSRSDLDTW